MRALKETLKINNVKKFLKMSANKELKNFVKTQDGTLMNARNDSLKR